MNSIIENIKALPEAGRMMEMLRAGQGPCSLLRVAEGAKSSLYQHLNAALARPVFVICEGEAEAKERLSSCYSENKAYYPAPHPELRVVEAKSVAGAAARAAVLARLARSAPLVFLSADALLARTASPAAFAARVIRIKKGEVLPPRRLAERLAEAGYERTGLVEAVGAFSGRGEICDVFPPGYEQPLRITYFDDEIESIRRFDADTQRSFGKETEEALLPPAGDICLNEEEKALLAAWLRGFEDKPGVAAEAAGRMCYELDRRGTFPNIEAYMGMLPAAHTVADFAEKPLFIFDGYTRIKDDIEKRRAANDALLHEAVLAGEALGCENGAFVAADDFVAAHAGACADIPGVMENALFMRHTADLGMISAVGFMGNIDRLAAALKDRAAAGYRCYLFAGSRGKGLSQALAGHDIAAPVINDKTLSAPGVCIVPARIPGGFELAGGKALFLCERDIFGDQGTRSSRRGVRGKKKRNENEFLADLHPGDIIVHDIHGKGRFIGIKNMQVGGASADYIELEYKDGDRLFIKTDQIDRIDKYIGPGDEDAPRLSKLGGKEWENAKARAGASIKKLAEDLVAIYRERGMRHGYRFSPDTVWQQQFEDAFEYEDTPGQAESSEEIKRDMESDKIMDRLLLGDVGYGKTEVAMRACMKAVMDSKQVAVLVPTTLLARQHYETFRERFAGFPVRIEMLSRFSKNPAAVIADINAGRVDIVIGTHKLLSGKIAYKDLGLLVVDEEQRFGVSHKERIKDMRRNIDVLTLTATPIPRTLEMAMTGIRDMSTIDTPPKDRKEVLSYVARFSWALVKEAIEKELARGGQVYFVVRRVGGMEEMAEKLHRFVPSARVIMAHGQMSEGMFEANVNAFYERRADVLLCTTIIESGIDIPSVNTVIVYEADKFGLAQLYQIRGRVGRSAVRAYAYFTHTGEGAMNPEAARRLAAIREFTQFGSGYKIAMRDLEIRGAGNIMGAEQSGHMAQIGYSLYCRLVKEEVDRALGTARPASVDTAVELGLDAFIPEKYIADEAQKLDMYRRIRAVGSVEEGRTLKAELAERYGAVPRPTENLIAAAVVRSFAAQAGIASVIRKGSAIEMKFDESTRLRHNEVMSLLAGYKDAAKLRPSTPPVIVFAPKKGRIYTEMLQLMAQIKRCIYENNTI